jgi:hypothetical protein
VTAGAGTVTAGADTLTAGADTVTGGGAGTVTGGGAGTVTGAVTVATGVGTVAVVGTGGGVTAAVVTGVDSVTAGGLLAAARLVANREVAKKPLTPTQTNAPAARVTPTPLFLPQFDTSPKVFHS